jgi:hypothetical protein
VDTPAFPKPVRAPKRRKPLRAKRWGIARKPPRRIERTGSDRAYIAWLHTQPCAFTAKRGTTTDPIEASHLRSLKYGSGTALKTRDRLALPMLRSVHREYEGRRGRFAGWSQQAREIWHTSKAAEFIVRFEREKERSAA